MKNILLIEPDKVLSKIYYKTLVNEGYEVKISNSAEEVMILIENFKPDLIILEIMINNHNGIEILNELKSYEDLYDCPVIINSVIPFDSQLISTSLLRSYKIKKYLYKPEVKLQELINLINEVLSNNETS